MKKWEETIRRNRKKHEEIGRNRNIRGGTGKKQEDTRKKQEETAKIWKQ